MKKDQKSILVLLAIFVVLLSTTLVVSFSSNLDAQEVIVKSITPVYDSNSTIEVDNNNVVFNDKNQVVEYKVVIENTQDYDVKITDIKLTTPTEEFLQYTVEDISKDDVLAANSTKELTISLETMGIKGWGRNFADELTANISFEKVVKEVTPPVEETPKEEAQPEAPATNIEEVINKVEKIEIIRATKDTIEFKETPKLENGDKVAVWIYSEPKFLGYFDVVVTNGVKQIVGLEEALKKAEITAGEHNIVLVTEEQETIGYINVYVNEDKEVLKEKPQDSTDKEATDKGENVEDDGKVENPYTSDKGLIIVLSIATCFTGVTIIIVSNNKFAKYTVFILMLSPVLSTTKAEVPIELSINNNVSFESQNVMKTASTKDEDGNLIYRDYWAYAPQIKNFYIQDEITEIEEYEYEFDVTNDQNGRVMAYLVEYKDSSICMNLEANDAPCYDLYLQADGIIYPNEDASFYFCFMMFLDSINNLEGMDTNKVTNMSSMFDSTGYSSANFTLDVSNFDTSNVTDMSSMFDGTGYRSTEFTLDVSNFDTSNVTDMSSMFMNAGYSSTNFTLDVSNFDTSNVTNMSYMFRGTGYNSTNFTLDVSNFDTSNVTDMSYMFYGTGYNSTKLNTSITISNPNTTNYYIMFYNVATKEGTQITVNYTSETEELVDKMIATKSSNSNVVKGNLIVDVDNLAIGDEIYISGEKFNIISQTDNTITMLAQYNLGTDYKQSSVPNGVKFADTNGWEYTPGPKEIDIQTWSANPKTYVNEYVEYLKEELGDNSVTGDLITLKELEELGCTVPSDYDEYYGGASGWDCYDSPYVWIVNGQWWWTSSASSTYSTDVWCVSDEGYLNSDYYSYYNGVRPVITISKSLI